MNRFAPWCLGSEFEKRLLRHFTHSLPDEVVVCEVVAEHDEDEV
jgi:hypothetical protein